jgi:hypothetical protein
MIHGSAIDADHETYGTKVNFSGSIRSRSERIE